MHPDAVLASVESMIHVDSTKIVTRVDIFEAFS